MSVLMKFCSIDLKNSVVWDDPIGKYCPKKQIWEIEGLPIKSIKDFEIYMGTGSPTTYSATTSNIRGKLDNGRDDTGT
jgi:hypothetical protein